MSSRRGYALAALAVGALACPGVERPVERPRLRVTALSATWRDSGELVVHARMDAANPNGAALTAHALDWELSLGGSTPWRGRQALSAHLPARATTTIELALPVPAALAGDMVARHDAGMRGYRLAGVAHFAGRRGEISAHIDAAGELLLPRP